MSKKRKAVVKTETTTNVISDVRGYYYAPLNEEQKDLWTAIASNSVIIVLGPPGTAKTFTAVAYCAKMILEKKYRKLFVTRPAIAMEDLGYLPGDAHSPHEGKLGPYLAPIIDALDDIVGKTTIDRKRIDECLTVCPISYMRGRSLRDLILVDECQNLNPVQLTMVLTRLNGKHSKMILCGDPNQSDLGPRSGLMPFVNRVANKNIDGLKIVRLSDKCIVRHPIIEQLLPFLQQPEK
jgi:phosphate starvation-inducible PhoH-like protein